MTGRRHLEPLRKRRKGRAAAFLAAVLLVAAGCGRIPTHGPVYHYNEPKEKQTSAAPSYTPAGPKDGASPQQILQGFIKAGTGVENDYSVAREYLTTELSGTWKPDDRTLVYSDSPSISSDSDDKKYTAEVSVTTSVDNRGIATSYTGNEKKKVTAEFTKVSGQWRISAIPNGTIVSRNEFEQLFKSFTLYFYDPTFTYAVPDVRWFANRSTVATSIVRVLLQGPAPYLEGSVASAVPSGTTLMRQSVPISNSSAEVGLTGDGVSGADQLALERLNTQLTQTLEGTNSVKSVRLSVDDKAVETGKVNDYHAATVNPQVPSPQVGVLDGNLVTYAYGQSRKVSGLAEQEVEPAMPTMDKERRLYAYTDEGRSHLAVRSTDGASLDTDLEGPITAPSIDPRKWVWTADEGGGVVALDGDGTATEPTKVSADWLRGQKVRSLKISRDGTRALIVTGSGKSSRVWISGIERDDKGKPQSLQKPLRVGNTGNATQAAWVSDTEVVVADTEDGSVQTVSLSGETKETNGLTDIQHISAGNGDDSIYAQTGEDTYVLTGTSWTRMDTKVHDLSYAG